ncbi:hypothetical protein OsJ_27644 [Oryza sativa Japonica Group]|uniref:Uncharacterized protein n=1 Tax=Oryza sativa subsp. japonica TaxID=39947 RepID=B9G1D4_ORYSJ|nr:hypothetical protein OsJ_27644 [Oryza sativa Japonica Group]
MWRRLLPPVHEDLRRSWGRRPTRRGEDAAAGDEPRAVSSCDIEDLVCVASRQRHIVAEPPAGDTSTKRGGASVAGAREQSDGGGRLAGAREGRGGGGGSQIWGVVIGGRVLPRPRSTPNPNLVAGSRILPHPRSISELVAGDCVLRRELVTSGRVRRPCLNMRPRSPRRSSSPAPPPSPRRILRRPRPTLELVAGAVSITTQDPPPSMRPCPTLELAGGRVLHAGARRRRPRPPRRSSSSAPPELVVGIADVSSSTLAAPTVARALVSQGSGKGAIPLGQYPNGIPVYSSFPI